MRRIDRSLTYRGLMLMSADLREHILGVMPDDDYRLLMAMVAYHTRRDAYGLNDRTVHGLIQEGRLRRGIAHDERIACELNACAVVKVLLDSVSAPAEVTA